MDFTSTGLIASVKRRGFIPRGSGLSDADILLYLSDELRTYIPSFLKGIREEYLVASLDIPVTSGTVPAPARAVGAALRTVEWLTTATQPYSLTRVEPERVPGYAGLSGEPVGYWLQGNNLILLPAPTSGTLRLTYQQRPGQLVLPSACASVVGLDGSTALEVESVPGEIEVGTRVDIVSGAPNFELYAMDLLVLSVDPVTIGFGTLDITSLGIEAPAYICVAGETCVAQMPFELSDLLAQATAYRIAQATGSSRANDILKGLSDLREQMTVLLAPRVDGSARLIINRVGVGARQWWGW